MKIRILIPAVLIAAASQLGSAGAQDKLTATPLRLTEYRYGNLRVGAKKNSFLTNRIDLRVQLVGNAVAKGTRIGKITATIKDDQSKTLPLSKSFSRQKELKRISRLGLGFDGKLPDFNKTEVNINFEAPGRASKSIESIQGEVTIRMAETTDVLIPLADLDGKKTIENAELKKLGLAIEVTRYRSSKFSTSFAMKVAGDKFDTLASCVIVDGNGKIVSSYHSTSKFFSSRKYIDSSGSVRAKHAAGAKLKLTVEKSFKDVKHAFELKNIPLP